MDFLELLVLPDNKLTIEQPSEYEGAMRMYVIPLSKLMQEEVPSTSRSSWIPEGPPTSPMPILRWESETNAIECRFAIT